jgi:outer membrane immunogenic protein
MTIRTPASLGLAVAALAVAFAGPAGAADIKAPPPPAPVLPFNWSGCYLGGFVGGAWQDDPVFTDLGNTLFAAYSGGVTVPIARAQPHSWSIGSEATFIGGGTLGCNWQPAGASVVFGIEGEGGFMSFSGAAFDPLLAPGVPVATVGVRAAPGVLGTPDVLGLASTGDWYAMITGRLGWAWDRVLIYAKGGLAFVPVNAAVIDNCLVVAAGCGNWIIATGLSETESTYTVGGGIEWAFAGNWSLKGEYMFIGEIDAPVTCALTTNPAGAIVPGGPFCFAHSFGGIHTAKVGLNFRFGPGLFGR